MATKAGGAAKKSRAGYLPSHPHELRDLLLPRLKKGKLLWLPTDREEPAKSKVEKKKILQVSELICDLHALVPSLCFAQYLLKQAVLACLEE
eukprot:3787060-Amphidinium_carterae.1